MKIEYRSFEQQELKIEVVCGPYSESVEIHAYVVFPTGEDEATEFSGRGATFDLAINDLVRVLDNHDWY